MTDELDPKFQELVQTLTTAIMLASNPGTEVSDITKDRLREPIKKGDAVRSNGGTPEEICAGIHGLLGAAVVLRPTDAMFLEPLRNALEDYEAATV